jgi:hypothetical protein
MLLSSYECIFIYVRMYTTLRIKQWILFNFYAMIPRSEKNYK